MCKVFIKQLLCNAFTTTTVRTMEQGQASKKTKIVFYRDVCKSVIVHIKIRQMNACFLLCVLRMIDVLVKVILVHYLLAMLFAASNGCYKKHENNIAHPFQCFLKCKPDCN